MTKDSMLWIALAGSLVTGGVCSGQAAVQRTAVPPRYGTSQDRVLNGKHVSAPGASRSRPAIPAARSIGGVGSRQAPIAQAETSNGLDGIDLSINGLDGGEDTTSNDRFTIPPGLGDGMPGGSMGSPDFGNAMARTSLESYYPRIREALRASGYGGPGDPNPVLQAAIAARRQSVAEPQFERDAAMPTAEEPLGRQSPGTAPARPTRGHGGPFGRVPGLAPVPFTSRTVGARQTVRAPGAR